MSKMWFMTKCMRLCVVDLLISNRQLVIMSLHKPTTRPRCEFHPAPSSHGCLTNTFFVFFLKCFLLLRGLEWAGPAKISRFDRPTESNHMETQKDEHPDETFWASIVFTFGSTNSKTVLSILKQSLSFSSLPAASDNAAGHSLFFLLSSELSATFCMNKHQLLFGWLADKHHQNSLGIVDKGKLRASVLMSAHYLFQLQSLHNDSEIEKKKNYNKTKVEQ